MLALEGRRLELGLILSWLNGWYFCRLQKGRTGTLSCHQAQLQALHSLQGRARRHGGMPDQKTGSRLKAEHCPPALPQ